MTGFTTKAIHEGSTPDNETGAVIPPIYQTSTFAQEAPGEHKGFEYTRADNPNYRRLEACLAALEEAKYATVFSSGTGASLAVLNLLKAGDHVVITGNPGRNPIDHRVRMRSLLRPSDGFGWGFEGETFD